MKMILSLFLCVLFSSSCSKKGENAATAFKGDIKGELANVSAERGLSQEHLENALKTFVPSGTYDDHLTFYGTGTSGRLVVLGHPSMRILKYVAVFSAEPWQGYAFDDESKSVIYNSSRAEVEYQTGDSGAPALSITNGIHDGRAVFLSDAANGRLALVDLKAYETKQIVSNPFFQNSNPNVVVTDQTKFVVETSRYPGLIKGLGEKQELRSGVTFWKFEEKKNDQEAHYFINPSSSITMTLPAMLLSSPAAGRQDSKNFVYFLGVCGPSDKRSSCAKDEEGHFLYVVDWAKLETSMFSSVKKISNQFLVDFSWALDNKLIRRFKLSVDASDFVVSGDGKNGAFLSKAQKAVYVLPLAKLSMEGHDDVLSLSKKISLQSTPVHGAFAQDQLLVSGVGPNELTKISISQGQVTSQLPLNFIPGYVMIPGADTTTPNKDWAIVSNHTPHQTFQRISPQMGLGAHLVETTGNLRSVYDASIPQSTRLAGVTMSKKYNTPVYKYKIGTDPRKDVISPYRTMAGSERIERFGKRVHVYATLIRSHITPDFIEVEQDDIVTIHLTSQEQSKDQTHGFTIDSYNVHGSWEPGKSAAVTFVADRAGVFPFYCTEFCSALHLEMQGYFLVKPKNMSLAKDDTGLNSMRQNPNMANFFKFIKGE